MDSGLEIHHIPPGGVSFVWEQIEPLIESALKRAQGDSSTVDTVKIGLLSGFITLWGVFDGEDILAILGHRLVHNPGNKVLFLDFLAGKEMERWIDQLENRILVHGDLLGVDCIESSSRLGMAEVLKKRGWKKKAVIMEAPRTNG